MVLINKEAKTVQIVNDFNKDYDRATDYDWNSGGGFMRSTAIAIEKRRASIPKNAGDWCFVKFILCLRVAMARTMGKSFFRERPIPYQLGEQHKNRSILQNSSRKYLL